METTYKCTICGKEKPFKDFVKRNNRPKNARQPYCLECHAKKRRDNYIGGQFREWDSINKYGVTKEQYDKLVEQQNGVCAICQNPQIKKHLKTRLSIDHDHVSGRVRGLLCDTCNRALGLFKDNVVTLGAAYEYLKKSYVRISGYAVGIDQLH